MLILEQADYRYTSSAVWAFYRDRIHQYFTLFNTCREAAEKKEANPNQAFVCFVLKGLFSAVNRLHDKSNYLIAVLLYQFHLSEARTSKKITDRQYELIRRISMTKASFTQADLFKVREIHVLYQGRTIRTYYRDIAKLAGIGLLIETDNKIMTNTSPHFNHPTPPSESGTPDWHGERREKTTGTQVIAPSGAFIVYERGKISAKVLLHNLMLGQ